MGTKTHGNNRGTRGVSTELIVILALFAAISTVLVYLVHIPLIPSAPYLQYDPADVMILVFSMTVSPWWSLLLTVVVSLVQGLLISGFNLGILMHIIATGAAALICGLIYRRRSGIIFIVISLAAAVIAAITVMLPMNYLLTPLYTGLPRSEIAKLIPTVFLPFNTLKFGINAVITGIIFKPVGLVMRKSGIRMLAHE